MLNQVSEVSVLVIGVHPDDSELGAGGTLAKCVAEGKTVGMVDLTQGELGTRGSIEIRKSEADASARVLGASWRINLKFKDGFFEINKKNKMALSRLIRLTKPEIILANAIFDRHPDHGRAAQLVREACFFSGLEKIEILDDTGIGLPRWRPRLLLHYIQDYSLEPDVIVDISGYQKVKEKSIKTFKSQFYDPMSTESNSPLTSPVFIDQIMGRCASWGRQIGVDYGEAFTLERFVGVNTIFDLV